MKDHAIIAIAAFAALAAPALAAQYDGKLPLYPRGHVAAGMESIPVGALARHRRWQPRRAIQMPPAARS